jgi:dolichol-phosphate mannosyltransferase
MSKALVIIPTYNEKENIEKVIESVFLQSISFHVLVVDDNSPDGTALEVKKLQQKFSERLHLEVREGKSGLGSAYLHGFSWALKKSYEFIFEMDADFSHNPDDLVRLFESFELHQADVVIGSRYISGVNVVNWPLNRVLMSYFASVYVRMIMGFKVHDATAGFIGYRRTVLEKIELHKVKFVGYAFQIEMKYRAYVKGFTLIEIPIIFTDRTQGVSKMSNAIISEAIWGVLLLRVKKIFNKL